MTLLESACSKKEHSKKKKSQMLYHVLPFLSRITRCPARVSAWAFCGGSPQLRGMQLGGRVALSQQWLLVPVLSSLPRMQLSFCWHQGHGGEPGKEQRGVEQLQPRVHGIRYGFMFLSKLLSCSWAIKRLRWRMLWFRFWTALEEKCFT